MLSAGAASGVAGSLGGSRLRSAVAVAGDRLALHRLQLSHIGRREVDRVEQQWRESAVADGVGDDLASEREEQARSLDQKERLQRLIRDVPEAKETCVGEVYDEMDAVVRTSGDFDLQGDLV